MAKKIPDKIPEKTPDILPMTQVQLSGQNQSFLDKVCREFREELLRAQQKRGDGRITLDAHLSGGQINGIGKVRNEWQFRL